MTRIRAILPLVVSLLFFVLAAMRPEKRLAYIVFASLFLIFGVRRLLAARNTNIRPPE